MLNRPLLRQLQVIDRERLTVRDTLVLYLVIETPGMCGQDIQKKLGFTNRSAVHSQFARLIKHGMIVDLREREAQAVPSRYYATDKGKEFWGAIENV